MMIVIVRIRSARLAQNSPLFKIDAGKFSKEYTGAGGPLINSKTMDNFGRMFAGATNVIWTKDKQNVDRVYFETKGKFTWAGFNKQGHFLYSITSYPEEMLPMNILRMVKKHYYSRHIFGITEVNTLNKTAYLVMMDHATSWLHIKVLDGELTEVKVLLKAI